MALLTCYTSAQVPPRGVSTVSQSLEPTFFDHLPVAALAQSLLFTLIFVVNSPGDLGDRRPTFLFRWTQDEQKLVRHRFQPRARHLAPCGTRAVVHPDKSQLVADGDTQCFLGQVHTQWPAIVVCDTLITASHDTLDSHLAQVNGITYIHSKRENQPQYGHDKHCHETDARLVERSVPKRTISSPTQAPTRAQRVTTFPATPITTRNRQPLAPTITLFWHSRKTQIHQTLSLELTTQTPLNFQFRVHGAVGEGSIPEACLANPTASQLSFEKNRNSVPCTCETRIVKGLFAVHKQYGSVLPQRTTSVSPQHHFVVSHLTRGIWNSHDRFSGLTAWTTRESTRKTGKNCTRFCNLQSGSSRSWVTRVSTRKRGQ